MLALMFAGFLGAAPVLTPPASAASAQAISFHKTMSAIGKNLSQFGEDTKNAVGLGDEANYFYACTDPGFFVIRNHSQVSGEDTLILKGTLTTPQAGYGYGLQMVSVSVAEAFAVLSVGQPVNANSNPANGVYGGVYGRGLPVMSSLQVEQPLNLPEKVGLLHVRVIGLTPQPTEFTCDITNATTEEQNNPPPVNHQDDRFNPQR